MLEVLLAAQGGVVAPEELRRTGLGRAADPLTNSVRMTIITLAAQARRPAARATPCAAAGYRV